MEILDLNSIKSGAVISSPQTIRSADGTRLYLHSWRGEAEPDKIVVVIHGLGGHGGYYADSLAPFLVPAGAVVYAPDLRGCGRSEGQRGDASSFTPYQDDVAVAVQHARLAHPNLPLFLLGESMGTSIAIIYTATAPEGLKPDFLTLVACVVAPTVKPRVDEVFRTSYYFMRNRQRVAIPITGREEQGIRDPGFIQVLKSDALFNRKVSVRFLTSMNRHMQQAAQYHARLNLPVLVLQGGKDITVRHRATRAFFKRITAPDKEMHYFDNAYHAILNDPDSPLVRQKLLAWLDRQTLAFTTENTGNTEKAQGIL